MKLTILCRHFYPTVGSTGQMVTELAVELCRRGLDVDVYTSRNVYGWNDPVPRKERYMGVSIERLPSLGLSKDKKIPRIVEGIIFFVQCFAKLLISRDRSPLFITTNPPFLPIMGWIVKRMRGRKYILLLYDIHPDMTVALGWLSPTSLVAKIWEWFNRFAYGHANTIVVIGDEMKELMASKMDSIQEQPPIEIIPNWTDGDFVKPIPKEENWFRKMHDLGDKTVVLYSGSIALKYGLEALLEAAEQLKNVAEIQFLLIGDGAKKTKLMGLKETKALDNVKFLPYQPREYLSHSLTCGDIVIVSQDPTLDGLIVPGKMYPALASGQAVLGIVGQNTEVARTIRTAQCGLQVDPGDIQGLVEAILKLHRDPKTRKMMGKNGREYFEKHFDKPIIMNRYYDTIVKVCSETIIADQ